ncbi:hypothetical protein KCU93_g2675, partial [Aureobasidium melanogenum]
MPNADYIARKLAKEEAKRKRKLQDQQNLEATNKVQKRSPSTTATSAAPFNNDTPSNPTVDEEKQRQLRARYLGLMDEIEGWKETLDIVKSAKPLPIATISEVMNMRHYMKGALAAAENFPKLTQDGKDYNDDGKMMTSLHEAVRDLDIDVAAGDNEHAILVNLAKVSESNAQRKTYLPMIYNLVQSASLSERDELKEKLNNTIERNANAQKKAQQQILEIEKDIETRQKSSSESQGDDA